MITKEKNKINREIGKVVKPIYFDEIPLGQMFDIIKDHGYQVVDEAGEPWSGFLCGREGTFWADIMSLTTQKLSKYRLILQWYKMPSGRYEVISYVG